MPLVVSQKQRIHYEIEGDHGPYLVLHPPFPDSLECFYRLQYVEELKGQYRLVLIDPLGQGKSDAPEDEQFYTIESRITHLFDVMAELRIDSFHFLGFDIGGQLGYALAAKHPHRLRSLAVVGAHAFALTTEQERLAEQIRELRDQDIESTLKRFADQQRLSEERRKEIAPLNCNALAAALEAIRKWEGVGDSLQHIRTHGILFTETSEDKFMSIRETGRSMSYARYHIFSEIQYQEGLIKADQLIPQLLEFIRRQRQPHDHGYYRSS